MWLLPLIYTGASCAEKYLIDGSVKDQYATCKLGFEIHQKISAQSEEG